MNEYRISFGSHTSPVRENHEADKESKISEMVHVSVYLSLNVIWMRGDVQYKQEAHSWLEKTLKDELQVNESDRGSK